MPILIRYLGKQQTYLVIKNGGWIGWKLVYWGWTITIANWTITLNMITKKGEKTIFKWNTYTLYWKSVKNYQNCLLLAFSSVSGHFWQFASLGEDNGTSALKTTFCPQEEKSGDLERDSPRKILEYTVSFLDFWANTFNY